MRAGGGSAKARPAEGASANSTEKRKVTEPGAAAGKEKKKVAASEPIADPGTPAPKVDYRSLYDVPECPVFHPTAREFNHPGKYIESISEQVRLLLPHQAEMCARGGPESSQCLCQIAGPALWHLQNRAAALVEAAVHDRPQNLHRAHACPASQLFGRTGAPAAYIC
jgi:hypothetical protein